MPSLVTHNLVTTKMAKLTVNQTEITLISEKNQDYISLTDMANAKDGSSRAADIIKNWIRAS